MQEDIKTIGRDEEGAFNTYLGGLCDHGGWLFGYSFRCTYEDDDDEGWQERNDG